VCLEQRKAVEIELNIFGLFKKERCLKIWRAAKVDERKAE